MENGKSKLITGCLVAAVIILSLCLLAWFPFRSSSALQISYIRTTNDPAFGQIAFFDITNESSSRILFITCPPQTKLHGTWSKLVFYGGYGTNLPAHCSTTFTNAVPTNTEALRVPVYWWYADISQFENVRDRVEANVYFNWQRLAQGQSLHFFNSSLDEGHITFSPEVPK